MPPSASRAWRHERHPSRRNRQRGDTCVAPRGVLLATGLLVGLALLPLISIVPRVRIIDRSFPSAALCGSGLDAFAGVVAGGKLPRCGARGRGGARRPTTSRTGSRQTGAHCATPRRRSRVGDIARGSPAERGYGLPALRDDVSRFRVARTARRLRTLPTLPCDELAALQRRRAPSGMVCGPASRVGPTVRARFPTIQPVERHVKPPASRLSSSCGFTTGSRRL